ncbi:hypothetical protein C8J56DRAFT_901168 [Mycena floridula]|nr:hypothetical protein C8J56DRAFT_901168 [Mycena floridula]
MNLPENVAAISKKRKSGGALSDETDLRMAELTKKYRTLGAHLWCKHDKDHCYMKANALFHTQEATSQQQDSRHRATKSVLHYHIATKIWLRDTDRSSRQNLPDEAGTKTTPIEIIESPSASSGYPLVADILCHMDNLPDFRNLEIPPSTFATYLEHEWELTTVKQAAIVHWDTFIDGASMTLALANTFIALSQKAVHEAKGKGT